MTRLSTNDTPKSPDEYAFIVQDLQTHQIELEMQNEELRNAQNSLDASRQRYSQLYNWAPVGYLTIDEMGVIREANLTVSNMLNTERHALLHRPLSAFVVREYQDTLYLHRRRLDETDRTEHCELRLSKADGNSFWARIESNKVISQCDGRPTGFQCAISDISGRKEAEALLLKAHEELEEKVELRTAALRSANEALKNEILEHKRTENERLSLERQIQQAQKTESLGVLAGGIAHDFNNLLMGILGYADLALLSISPEERATAYLKKMKATAICLSDLTNQMLAYAGKGQSVVELIDLSHIVEEMRSLLNFPVSKKVTVKYDIEPGLPLIEGDRNQQCQVILNLMTNASEAIGDNVGQIVVRSGVMEARRAYLSTAVGNEILSEGRYVYLEVSDTGKGMSEETRCRIFEPFYTTKFSGRGLGLAAVLGIVRGHNGAIVVDSRLGQGTTIRILYPCAANGCQPPIKIHTKRVTGNLDSSTILLVDDEAIVREVACSMITRLGCNVLIAENGVQALEIFGKNMKEIDCVLLDLSMPEMDGESVFRELRQMRDDVCVILSSGFSEHDLKERFGECGLAGFLPKPYEFKTLKKKLEAVLVPSIRTCR